MTLRQRLHDAVDEIADAIEAELYGPRPKVRRGRRPPTEKTPPKPRVVPTELQRAKARRRLGLAVGGDTE